MSIYVPQPMRFYYKGCLKSCWGLLYLRMYLDWRSIYDLPWALLLLLMEPWHSIFNALCTLTHNFGLGAIKLMPIEHYICVEEKLLYHDLDGVDTWGLKYYIRHQEGNVSIFIKMLFLNYFLKTFLPPTFSDGIYYVLNTCLHYWSSLVRHVAKNQSTIQMLLLLTYSLLV